MTRSSMLRTFLVTDFQVTGCQMPFACAVSAYDQDDALDSSVRPTRPTATFRAPGPSRN